jgi:predicted transcriptional regulator YdeE
MIGSHVTIHSNIHVGQYCRISDGVDVDEHIPDYTWVSACGWVRVDHNDHNHDDIKSMWMALYTTLMDTLPKYHHHHHHDDDDDEHKIMTK